MPTARRKARLKAGEVLAPYVTAQGHVAFDLTAHIVSARKS
jgi:hypothetical protein